jgi:hypothetical protein
LVKGVEQIAFIECGLDGWFGHWDDGLIDELKRNVRAAPKAGGESGCRICHPHDLQRRDGRDLEGDFQFHERGAGSDCE